MARKGLGRRLAAVTATAFLMTAMVSPAAFAQEVTDPVTEVTDPVTEVTDPVTEPLPDTGEVTVPDTGEVPVPVPGTGEKEEEPTVPNTGVPIVDDTVDDVEETLKDPVDDAKEVVKDPKGTLEDTAGSVEDSVKDTTGGLSVPPLLGNGGSDGNGDGKDKNDKRDGKSGGSTLVGGHRTALNGEGRPSGLERSAPADGVQNRGVVITPASAESAPSESVVEEIARVATETAKRLAFPLALLAVVGGFLVIQGRVDRKDPKLALAPLEGDDDRLSFD